MINSSKYTWMNVEYVDRERILNRIKSNSKEKRLNSNLNSIYLIKNFDINDMKWEKKFKNNGKKKLSRNTSKTMSQFRSMTRISHNQLKTANVSVNMLSEYKHTEDEVSITQGGNVKLNENNSQISNKVDTNKEKSTMMKFFDYICVKINDNCCLDD